MHTKHKLACAEFVATKRACARLRLVWACVCTDLYFHIFSKGFYTYSFENFFITCSWFAQYLLFAISSQHARNLFTISFYIFYILFKACSALVRNNVTPCLWLVNNIFTIFSQLVYMRTTSLWLIHNWFTTCSWFGHNLFMICLIIFHHFHPIWSISQFTITKL